jgi:hypothetical protein
MKGRYYSEDLVVDGRIILEWILEKWGMTVYWVRLILHILVKAGEVLQEDSCLWRRTGHQGRQLVDTVHTLYVDTCNKDVTGCKPAGSASLRDFRISRQWRFQSWSYGLWHGRRPNHGLMGCDVVGILTPHYAEIHICTTFFLSAEVDNTWSYTSTRHYVLMTWYLIKHRDNFTFTSFQ